MMIKFDFLTKILKKVHFFLKRKYHELIIFNFGNKEKVFKEIYKNNYWGSAESLSGPGSDMKNSHNIRIQLPNIISKYNIKKIIDVPCGDFYWMKTIINSMKVHYNGYDIVQDLIDKNKKLFTSENINFDKLDITKQHLPKSDLII